MRRGTIGFIASGCVLTGVFLIAVNLFTDTSLLWSVYCTVILLSPVFWLLRKGMVQKLYVLIMSLLLMLLFFIQNIIETPHYLWVIYLIAPLVTGPVMMFFGKKSLTRKFAVIGGLSLISYYIGLNVFFEPRFPWSIFTTFALLWWPFALLLAHRPKTLAIAGSVLIGIFLTVVNLITSPQIIWAINPIFAILWWPLSIWLARNTMVYAVSGSVLVIAYFSAINSIYSPQVLWAVYPIFAVLWWPLSVYYFADRRERSHHRLPEPELKKI
ncbi:hypothetical protein E4665_09130 [Sporolactobacillus shoreae]|uniref:Uncharacterized protein n=1 Tax=Sporolactobacillus shoreae TaxID=1465501 RepID=A0A4Z0GM62_9BACL|nr:hypothetical protein [Sporolactobacillus shoreae]TGA98108.1 hypothetical protein E4665_09130 [Sporolactobacillus shoreae]